jgi:predicted AlkP superfamily phosphohydrolase/phosphomutase
MSKVLIVGLDGATWRLFGPWVRAGRLPHLGSLMARGTWGTLRSTVPALTMPAWASFMTGKNPGQHGIFAFRRLSSNSYEPRGIANASDLRCATLWDLAGRAGKQVGVINVPPSYPIRPVNGFVVSCMLTPPGETRFTDPPEVAAELGDYTINVKVPPGMRSDAPGFAESALSYLEALSDQTRRRASATVRLMERRPWDLLCVVFYAPDRIQHYFWNYLDGMGECPDPGDSETALRLRSLVRSIYETLDEELGRLIEAAGPDTAVVILSDHGFAPAPERIVRVNRWLAERGFLHQRWAWRLRRKVIRKLLPRPWRDRYDTIDHILIDRAKTRAWCDAMDDPGTGGIWIHTRDRYALGCVPPGTEYEQLRSDIQEGLRALRDERGFQVFRAVHRREELYSGRYVTEAPDLIVECEQRFGLAFSPLSPDLHRQQLFGPFGEGSYVKYSGSHDPAGIYLFAGPTIRALGEHEEYPIESIAPTVLHLLGLPVPRTMDGPVCTDVLDRNVLNAHPVQFYDDQGDCQTELGDWMSKEDEALVKERLRELGYLG